MVDDSTPVSKDCAKICMRVKLTESSNVLLEEYHNYYCDNNYEHFADVTIRCNGKDFDSLSGGIRFESEAQQTKKQTPWSESASELYRPSDCRLSAK
jgi:hypothetical protein